MRVAAIAGAVVAAFIGVMYLRFSGDAVPPPQPRPSPIVGADGRICVVTVRSGAPDPTATPVGGEERMPCSGIHEPTPHSVLQLETPTPGLPPVPEFLRDVELVPLSPGKEAPFPDNLSVLVTTGCYACDGAPADGLSRVYRDPSGAVRVDILLTNDGLSQFLTAEQRERIVAGEGRPAMVGLASNEDGSEIVVGVCVRGICLSLEGPSADGTLAFLRSTNGGVTWAPYGELERGGTVIGLVRSGTILLATRDTGEDQIAFITFPGETMVVPPVNNTRWPDVLPGRDVGWQTDDHRLLRGDGSIFVDLGNPPPPLTDWHFSGLVPATENHFLTSIQLTHERRHIAYLVELGPNGRVTRAYSVDPLASPSLWLADDLVLGTGGIHLDQLTTTPAGAFQGHIPVVLDLQTRQVHPIGDPFVKQPLLNQRNNFVAVQRGPFARVANTDGDCLNIRAEPGTGAVLDCAAEGVLLRNLLQTTDAAGVAWLRVRTPAGLEGWASTQYLER